MKGVVTGRDPSLQETRMPWSELLSVDRRHFLLTGAAATASLVAIPRFARAADGPTVAVVRDKTKQVSVEGKIDAALVQKLVDKAVMTMAGADDVAKAWGKFVGPKDKVAVKYNGLFAKATTRPEVLDAITKGLLAAGLDPANIVIFDRDSKDIQTAGLTANREGPKPRVVGTDGAYGDEMKAGPIATRLSKHLLDADVFINVPMMKTHRLASITGALKNLLGCVPNAGAFHPDENKQQTVRYLADISTLGPVKAKTRLCIADALNAQYHQGPSFSPRHRWDFGGIVAGTDPVAFDTILAELIKAKRVESGLEPLLAPIRHLERAIELGLGCGDLKKINRVDVEV
jgi:uncharacterized protein (DUF362 family)